MEEQETYFEMGCQLEPEEEQFADPFGIEDPEMAEHLLEMEAI
jgi:hypothetical protein